MRRLSLIAAAPLLARRASASASAPVADPAPAPGLHARVEYPPLAPHLREHALLPPVLGGVRVSLARSNRGQCAACGLLILDGMPRLGVSLRGKGDFTFSMYSHVACFEHTIAKLYPREAIADVSLFSGLDHAPSHVADALLRVAAGGRADATVASVLGRDLAAQVAEQRDRRVAIAALLGELSGAALTAELRRNYPNADLSRVGGGSPDDGGKPSKPTRAKKAAASAAAAVSAATSGSRDRALAAVIDGALFGPIADLCGVCKTGLHVEDASAPVAGALKCTGSIDQFTACWAASRVDEVQRKERRAWIFGDAALAAQLPAGWRSAKPAAPVVVERLLAAKLPAWLAKPARAGAGATAAAAVTPLRGARFCVVPDASQSALAKAAQELVQELGGSVTAVDAALASPQSATPRVDAADEYETVFVWPGAANKRAADALRASPEWARVTTRFPRAACVSLSWLEQTQRLGRRVLAMESAVLHAADHHYVLGAPDLKTRLESRDAALAAKKLEAAAATAASTAGASAVTLRNKGLVVVDPDSGLGATHEVAVATGDKSPYSATLLKADVLAGANSNYVLQVLVSADANRRAVLFRKWGRIGDAAGTGTSVEAFPTVERAAAAFARFFKERTGNAWGAPGGFTKVAGRYNWVDQPDPDGDAKHKQAASKTAKAGGRVVLSAPKVDAHAIATHAPTRALVSRMLDPGSLTSQLELELKIDVRQMPLATLNLRAISQARAVLNDIASAIRSREAKPRRRGAADDAAAPLDTPIEIVSLSNQFYSSIPVRMERGADSKALFIDTAAKVSEKQQLLMDLEDVLLAKQLGTVDQGSDDPIVQRYRNLNCALEPIDLAGRSADADAPIVHPKTGAVNEAELLLRFARNGQASTHTGFTVKHAWRVERAGERQRYDAWCAANGFPADSTAAARAALRDGDEPAAGKCGYVGKRLLLWHGSGFVNWSRILHSGLLIAPPGVVIAGAMFNSGVYAANAATKSANYSRLHSRETGLIALIEVAVGVQAVRYMSDSSFTLRSNPGTHSCLARGGTTPDPAESVVLPGGVVAPVGPLVPSQLKKSTSLLYDEVIVYQVEQCALRYLLEISSR
jgi:hypothetical protein